MIILLRIPQPNLQRKVEFLAMKRINLEENNNDDCINNLLFKFQISQNLNYYNNFNQN